LKALQEKSKIINPGTSQSTNERKVRQTKYKLQQNLERDPDNFEIATELGRDVSEVEKVQEHTLSTVSLDAPVGSEVGSASLADLLSTSLPSPDSEIIADGISQEVYDLLDLIE
jgi:DNA-directed RNA polymerase sigma subunit (sigma70/sigma32)